MAVELRVPLLSLPTLLALNDFKEGTLVLAAIFSISALDTELAVGVVLLVGSGLVSVLSAVSAVVASVTAPFFAIDSNRTLVALSSSTSSLSWLSRPAALNEPVFGFLGIKVNPPTAERLSFSLFVSSPYRLPAHGAFPVLVFQPPSAVLTMCTVSFNLSACSCAAANDCCFAVC